jgi:uncharacterized protein YjbI with pentapeptide repeats
MANDEHVALLKQGVDAWNAWRRENPDMRPDLSDADLEGADLSKANLEGANLRKANLSGVKLIAARLSEADLEGANLLEAKIGVVNLAPGARSRHDLELLPANVKSRGAHFDARYVFTSAEQCSRSSVF